GCSCSGTRSRTTRSTSAARPISPNGASWSAIASRSRRRSSTSRRSSRDSDVRARRRTAARVVLALAALLSCAATAARAQTAPELASLIDDLVVANRILYHQGVLDGFGHVSVRHPTVLDHFLMARALAPGRVTRDDILEFDIDAKPVKSG